MLAQRRTIQSYCHLLALRNLLLSLLLLSSLAIETSSSPRRPRSLQGQDASHNQQTTEHELPIQTASAGSCLPTELKPQTTDSYFQNSGFTEPQVSSFVRPNFYTLRLKVDPTKPKFAGQLMIALDVAEPAAGSRATSGGSAQAQTQQATSTATTTTTTRSLHNKQRQSDETQPAGYRYLTIHAGGNLSIKRAFYVYTSRGGVQIPASKLGRDPNNELLTIDFHPNVITAGQGLLLIVYSGLVNETESHGLFVHRSHKPRAKGSPTGVEDAGLATHMQPSFSRRLFPAWDAPHLKARFSLIVVLPFRNYQTLSNMPVRRKSFSLSCSGEPIQEVEFHTTPTMSTYLLTLVIGHFEFIEAQTPNNCLVRLYVYANQTATAVNHQHEISSEKPEVSTEQPDGDEPKLRSINRPMVKDKIEANAMMSYNQVNNKRSAAALGLDVAVKVIDKLENLLGVRYPLSKFDLVALRDFNSGGMENWGISIFHENYLLSESQQQPATGSGLHEHSSSLSAAISALPKSPGHSSVGSQIGGPLAADVQVSGGRNRPRRVVVPLVVAHEVAHQWFGNLVTAKSWTYLWLNEGFAQMLMYDLADSMFPELDYWHMFVEDTRHSAMHEDEMLTSSHTLEVNISEDLASQSDEAGDMPPVKSKEQRSGSTSSQLSLFDEITYNKGALIAKTVYHLFGREQFFSGLKHYLLKHSYESVSSHDLWLALEEANGLPDGKLDSIMQSWLKLEGFPVVSVAVHEEPNSWVLYLHQSRFSLLPLDLLATNKSGDSQQQQHQNASSTADCCWSLPVCVSSQLKPSPSDAEIRLLGAGRQTIAHERRSSAGKQPRHSASINSAAGACFLFSERYATISIPKSATGTWFKLNFNATGLYRVDYQLPASRWELSTSDGPIVMAGAKQQNGANQTPGDSHNHHQYSGGGGGGSGHHIAATRQPPVDVMNKMGAAVRDKTMCVIDRLNLADDLFAMVKSGRKPTSYYLDFIVAHYELEHEPIVLRLIVNSMKRIRVAIMSNGPKRPLALYDRYVQKFLPKLSRSVGMAKEKLISELALATATIGNLQPATDGINQQQQELRSQTQLQLAKLRQNINQLNEIEELIESSRVMFEDGEFLQTAVRLFGQNFRLPSPGASVFDTMDRETRAAIYTGALLASPNQQDLPLEVTLRTQDGEWLVPSKLQPKNRTHNLNRTLEALRAIDTTDVFMKLLRAYELSDSSAERFAISSALGNVRELNKRASLLDFTINYYYFRPQDLYNVLEAMARTRSGRQLIWSKLRSSRSAIAHRGLMPIILKSLQSGFIDPERPTTLDLYGDDSILYDNRSGTLDVDNNFDAGGDNNRSKRIEGDSQSSYASDSIEQQLRDLYHYYGDQIGEIISKTNEFILINTRWFNRDYTKLVQFLETKEG